MTSLVSSVLPCEPLVSLLEIVEQGTEWFVGHAAASADEDYFEFRVDLSSGIAVDATVHLWDGEWFASSPVWEQRTFESVTDVVEHVLALLYVPN